MYFEGPEKKLEILLKDKDNFVRKDNIYSWESIVNACEAEIIAKHTFQFCDAYLLSESSLFVYDDKILMILLQIDNQEDVLEELPNQ